MGYCVKSGGSGCQEHTGRIRVFFNQGCSIHCECCTLKISFTALSYLLSASGISLQLRGQRGKNDTIREEKGQAGERKRSSRP